MFNFSVPPSLDLEETGGILTEFCPGPREVTVELRNGDLFVGEKRVLAYIPAKQAEYPEEVELQEAVTLLEGLSLASLAIAQVLHDHPEIIPVSLQHQLEADYRIGGRSGLLFPAARVRTWAGKIAIPGLLTVDGKPHYTYSILDRLPRAQAYLIEL